MIVITIPGVALTEKKRQRFFGGKPGARTDEPDRKEFKARLAFFAKQECPVPLDGPLRMNLTVRRPKPASWPKKPCKSNPWPWAWWKRPDRSNYLKIVEDALNGICWHDDGQVVSGDTRKEWGPVWECVVTLVQVQEHYSPGSGSGAPEAGQ